MSRSRLGVRIQICLGLRVLLGPPHKAVKSSSCGSFPDRLLQYRVPYYDPQRGTPNFGKSHTLIPGCRPIILLARPQVWCCLLVGHFGVGHFTEWTILGSTGGVAKIVILSSVRFSSGFAKDHDFDILPVLPCSAGGRPRTFSLPSGFVDQEKRLRLNKHFQEEWG